MSLFKKLLNLHSTSQPLENFFTEIVAYFFSRNKDIFIDWLKHHSIISEDNYSSINIATQKYYAPLAHHDSGSQPDIVVELSNGSIIEVIFIESKIGSREGEGQLKRYAEILDHLPNFSCRNLIYITRDYEPKNYFEILHSSDTPFKVPLNVKFHQLRWHEFYSFLNKLIIDDFLGKEILIFMEVKRMAHTNQVSSVDILTMINFNKTLNFMGATLSQDVHKNFKEAFPGYGSESLKQWVDENRYIISSNFPSSSKSLDFWCGLGYFYLNPDSLAEYPYLGIFLEVKPGYGKRPEIIEAMKKIVNETSTKWTPHSLSDFTIHDWPSIFYSKSLQEFLSQKDHVSSIKEYFFESIEALKKVQKNHPNLPW